eukprot:6203125-Pleurochrysis_carterae.AAC.2
MESCREEVTLVCGMPSSYTNCSDVRSSAPRISTLRGKKPMPAAVPLASTARSLAARVPSFRSPARLGGARSLCGSV